MRGGGRRVLSCEGWGGEDWEGVIPICCERSSSPYSDVGWLVQTRREGVVMIRNETTGVSGDVDDICLRWEDLIAGLIFFHRLGGYSR